MHQRTEFRHGRIMNVQPVQVDVRLQDGRALDAPRVKNLSGIIQADVEIDQSLQHRTDIGVRVQQLPGTDLHRPLQHRAVPVEYPVGGIDLFQQRFPVVRNRIVSVQPVQLPLQEAMVVAGHVTLPTGW